MTPTRIALTEFAPQLIDPALLPPASGEWLWREYDQQRGWLRVEFPDPRTGHQWRVTSLGWVGVIPLRADMQLVITPKTPLRNLFQMWLYAYDLASFHWLDGVTQVMSLPAFYQELARLLAEWTLRRVSRGIYRDYVAQERPLPFIRGQWQWRRSLQPGATALHCRYDEFTADVPENQILAYTLRHILRGGWCAAEVQTAVARAYHRLQTLATPVVFHPTACANRSYTRLSEDYRPWHALCRFFLEHSGPTHQDGDHTMQPFLVNTARLYEQFVAAWLTAHLPHPWQLKVQEAVQLGERGELRFAVDLVVYNAQGQAQMVLDTKFKTAARVDHADLNQIVTYAQAKACRQAALIYPAALPQPLHAQLAGLTVRSLTFPLDVDLERAGQQFLQTLLSALEKR